MLAPSPFSRYVTYSSLIHLILLGAIIFSSLIVTQEKKYYTVEFMGTASHPAAPVQPAEPIVQKPVEEKTVKTRYINPKEDLVIKSKQKLPPNEKEIISDVPPPPPPPPGLKSVRSNAAIPGIVPSVESGVGIGFGDGGGNAGAGNFPYAWYVQSIKKKLDSNWNVTSGFSNRIYAQVVFTIKKDGNIQEAQVEEGSGNDIFDRAALRAVESASPLPPLPSGFDEPDLRVHVRFTVKR